MEMCHLIKVLIQSVYTYCLYTHTAIYIGIHTHNYTHTTPIHTYTYNTYTYIVNGTFPGCIAL